MDDNNFKSIISNLNDKSNVHYNFDGSELDFTGSNNPTEHFTSLFKYLIEKDYISKDDLPMSSIHAQNRYILNTSPNHRDSKMYRPREVADGIYLETNWDSDCKRRYSKLALERFV